MHCFYTDKKILGVIPEIFEKVIEASKIFKNCTFFMKMLNIKLDERPLKMIYRHKNVYAMFWYQNKTFLA